MKIINEKEFEREIKEGTVLVDFFATWCMPCRMMSQILEEVDRELDGKGKIVKVDVDQNEDKGVCVTMYKRINRLQEQVSNA